jgi:hypothetical protein
MIKRNVSSVVSAEGQRINPVCQYPTGLGSNVQPSVTNYYQKIMELWGKDRKWLLNNLGYSGASCNPKKIYNDLIRAIQAADSTRGLRGIGWGNAINPLVDIFMGIAQEEYEDGESVEVVFCTLTFLYEMHDYDATDNPEEVIISKKLYLKPDDLKGLLLPHGAEYGFQLYEESMGAGCPLFLNTPEGNIGSVFQVDLYCLLEEFPEDLLCLIS